MLTRRRLYNEGQRRNTAGASRLHLIMADAPIDEDEKIHHHNNGRNSDDASSPNPDADWIPAPNGGFIPNLGNLLRPKKEQTKTSSSSQRIMTVNNLLDYKRHVVDETDRLVCVRFYAPWCRACKAVAPLFARLATQFPTVKFVEVPLTKDNAFMLQGLGVPSLPYGHIYHPEAGLVEERKMNKKVFGKLAYILSTYVHGECALEDYEKILQKEVETSDHDDHDTILQP